MTSSRKNKGFTLNDVLKMQQEEEKRKIERIISVLKNHEIPTPADIRRDIRGFVGRRNELMRYHVFWEEHRLRLGMQSLVRAAHQAHVDICRHDAALGSLARADEFVDYTVGYTVQKDVIAYCFLAIGLKDTLRRIKKRRPDITAEIENIENAYYDQDVTAVVKKLRNNLAHGSVAIPVWRIIIGQVRPIGSMDYPKQELLEHGKWDDRSRRYLENVAGDHVSVSKIISEHFVLLEKLDRGLRDLFARKRSREEEDFFDIEDSYKRIAKQQWIKILIRQIGKGKDPYEYIQRHFDPKEYREILRRPKHSKEQVDFMIGLKGAEIDCDEELRNMLYQSFGADPEGM